MSPMSLETTDAVQTNDEVIVETDVSPDITDITHEADETDVTNVTDAMNETDETVVSD